MVWSAALVQMAELPPARVFHLEGMFVSRCSAMHAHLCPFALHQHSLLLSCLRTMGGSMHASSLHNSTRDAKPSPGCLSYCCAPAAPASLSEWQVCLSGLEELQYRHCNSCLVIKAACASLACMHVRGTNS